MEMCHNKEKIIYVEQEGDKFIEAKTFDKEHSKWKTYEDQFNHTGTMIIHDGKNEDIVLPL